MCGIAGSFGTPSTGSTFDQVFKALGHRGPDGSGIYRSSNLAMGMHRLRFRGADVALPVHDGGAVSAYNGQVYGELVPAGYAQVADGLAGEIALAAGTGSADGMYAYSSYAPAEHRVTLGTDWHFIKPLFVRQMKNEVVFASEMAPLLRQGRPVQLHAPALAELFAYGWYLSDQTCAAGVSLVWQSDLSIGVDGMCRQPKRALPPVARHDDDAAIPLRLAITESVRRSTLGAGPLGLALSGGLDSSILAWELDALGVEDLVCITVRTADGDDDLASLAELGLPAGGAWQTWRHVVVPVDDADFAAAFGQATRAFGQPTTMSSLPLYQRLADAAAAHGVRAMLLGEGVDEYFAGYASYGKVAALPALLDYYQVPARRRLVATLFGEPACAAAERRFVQQYRDAADLRTVETRMRLTRLLLRSDVCLMSRSIEGRVPFLYNDIPSLALSLPWRDVSAGPGKLPLRRAYARELGARALRPKVRFKSSDAMLLRCLDQQRRHVQAACGRLFGAAAVREALALLSTREGFDADVLCLLLSLTCLLEGGLLDERFDR